MPFFSFILGLFVHVPWLREVVYINVFTCITTEDKTHKPCPLKTCL